MIFLDMKTTVIIYVLVNYICAYIMYLTASKYKKNFKGLNYFFMHFIFEAVGLTLSSFRNILPDAITIILSNYLIFMGIILFLFAMSLFLDIKIHKKIYLIYSLIFASAYVYFTYFNRDIRVRILIFSSMALLIFINILYMLIISSNKKQKRYINITKNVFVSFAIIYVLRFYYAFTGGTITNYFSTPMMDIILVVLSQMCTIVLAYSLQHMITSRFFYKLESNSIELDILLKKAESLATTDALTNIFNRRKIRELLTHEIEIFKRYGNNFSILIADIDHFKRFNDTYGHDIGDKTLIKLTEVLAKNIRSTDYLGRWGGEEFIVIFPGLKLEEASLAAEKLIKVVENTALDFIDDSDEKITISIGLSTFNENSTYDIILKQADEALYAAKSNGRNQIKSYK